MKTTREGGGVWEGVRRGVDAVLDYGAATVGRTWREIVWWW